MGVFRRRFIRSKRRPWFYSSAAGTTVTFAATATAASSTNDTAFLGTIIFQDDLTDPTPTLLESWSPDIGTSWTRLWTHTSQSFQVISTGVRANVNAGDNGFIYTADATYPTPDYYVSFVFVQVFDTTTPFYALLRVQDQENMYAVRIVDGSSACQIYKKVSGTWTALGSTFDSPADGSLVKFSVVGTSLRVYDDGVEIASTTDSDITATGKAGVAHGGGTELVLSTDDIRAVEMFHTLTAVNLGTAAVSFAATIAATSSTNDTATLSITVPMAAVTTAASTTNDTATLSLNLGLSAVSTAASSTNDTATFTLVLGIAATTTAASTTNDTAALDLVLGLSAVATAASATNDTADLNVSGTITFAAILTGISSTTDTTALLVLPRNGELVFGEQSPIGGEIPTSWATWSDGAGGLPTITGDPDWGVLEVSVGEEARSRVYDMGSAVDRYWTVSENDYGSGVGTATLQIRGDTTPFLQDDVSPSWNNYSAPTKQTWRYIQIREMK